MGPVHSPVVGDFAQVLKLLDQKVSPVLDASRLSICPSLQEADDRYDKGDDGGEHGPPALQLVVEQRIACRRWCRRCCRRRGPADLYHHGRRQRGRSHRSRHRDRGYRGRGCHLDILSRIAGFPPPEPSRPRARSAYRSDARHWCSMLFDTWRRGPLKCGRPGIVAGPISGAKLLLTMGHSWRRWQAGHAAQLGELVDFGLHPERSSSVLARLSEPSFGVPAADRARWDAVQPRGVRCGDATTLHPATPTSA